MNAARVIEEPVQVVRIMPAPPREQRLEATFSIENFEVPIRCGSLSASQHSLDPDFSTPLSSNLLLSYKLTATETLCVRKVFKA